jgi:hypothetical protein
MNASAVAAASVLTRTPGASSKRDGSMLRDFARFADRDFKSNAFMVRIARERMHPLVVMFTRPQSQFTPTSIAA